MSDDDEEIPASVSSLDDPEDDPSDEEPKKKKAKKETKKKETKKKETKTKDPKAKKEPKGKAKKTESAPVPAPNGNVIKAEMGRAAVSKTATVPKAPLLPKNATESEVKALILNYMNDNNRPYSVIQLFENLHQCIPKPKMQQFLDKMVESGQICEKIFNKSKIYFPKQEDAPISSEELQEADNKIVELTEAVNIKKASIQEMQIEMKGYMSTVTPEFALEQIKVMEPELLAKQNKLASFGEKANQPVIDSDQLNDLYLKYASTFKEWKKRKCACLEMVDSAISETKHKVPKWMVCIVWTLCAV